MRNTSVHQGENERQWKKREQEHGSFWKFHVVVVQNNGKEMFKKVCCTRKVILLIEPIIFFPFSLPSPLSITRFYILLE